MSLAMGTCGRCWDAYRDCKCTPIQLKEYEKDCFKTRMKNFAKNRARLTPGELAELEKFESDNDKPHKE